MKLNIEGKEIELNKPLYKDVKKGMKLLLKVDALGGEESMDAVSAVEEYSDFIDNMAKKYSDIDVEELVSDDAAKVTSFYHDKVLKKFDFLKSSQRLGN